LDSISRLRDNAFLVRRTQTARPFRVFWLKKRKKYLILFFILDEFFSTLSSAYLDLQIYYCCNDRLYAKKLKEHVAHTIRSENSRVAIVVLLGACWKERWMPELVL